MMAFVRDMTISNLVSGNNASDAMSLERRRCTMYMKGTWGGAQAAVQIKSDVGGWIPLLDAQGNDIVFTKDSARPIECDSNDVRFVVSGGTGASLRAALVSVF